MEVPKPLSQITYLREKPTLEAPLNRPIDEDPATCSIMTFTKLRNNTSQLGSQFSGELQNVSLETICQHSVTYHEPTSTTSICMTPVPVYAPNSISIQHTNMTCLSTGTYSVGSMYYLISTELNLSTSTLLCLLTRVIFYLVI
jgi:hypothetical protein